MTEHPTNDRDLPTTPEPAPTDGEGNTRTLDPAVAQAEVGLTAGESIGPYRLLGIVGVGGFGVVWLAEQREPIRRRVALKVIKPGMDSAAVIARFEAERNALSVMDHPNIARVLDGGTTERGLPYFVMEHVPGEPITDYCARKKLGLNKRLEVFGQVCQAVQHAHTKGVIHRDLKPSNILVREVDDNPVAKVIDFGVAKALDQRLSEHTIFTARGHMIGTPEYMAPEQAEASGRDIDTRADVYSLGVVLYELLTGVRPFDFREIAYHEIGRVLTEVEPPKPSTRAIAALSAVTEAEDGFAVQSKTIARALKNDLDWVVMRCLEKDRTRRYQAASALGDDLVRFLSNEALEASPPSFWYRAAKLVRRHRGPALAVAATAGLLVATSAVVFTLYLEAEDQRRIAEQRAEDARIAQQTASNRIEDVSRIVEFQMDQIRTLDARTSGDAIARALRRHAGAGDRNSVDRLITAVDLADVGADVLDQLFAEGTVLAARERFDDDADLLFPLLVAAAQGQASLGRLDASAETLQEALSVAKQRKRESVSSGFAVHSGLAQVFNKSGDYFDSIIHGEEALERAGGIEFDSASVSLYQAVISSYENMQMPERATALVVDLAAAMNPESMSRESAMLLRYLARRHLPGVPPRALLRSETAEKFDEVCQERPSRAWNLIAFALVDDEYSDDEAHRLLDDIDQIVGSMSEEIGSTHPQTIIARQEAIRIAYRARDIDAVERIATEQLDAWSRSNDRSDAVRFSAVAAVIVASTNRDEPEMYRRTAPIILRHAGAYLDAAAEEPEVSDNVIDMIMRYVVRLWKAELGVMSLPLRVMLYDAMAPEHGKYAKQLTWLAETIAWTKYHSSDELEGDHSDRGDWVQRFESLQAMYGGEPPSETHGGRSDDDGADTLEPNPGSE